MGRVRGWEPRQPGSRPLGISFDRTSENVCFGSPVSSPLVPAACGPWLSAVSVAPERREKSRELPGFLREAWGDPGLLVIWRTMVLSDPQSTCPHASPTPARTPSSAILGVPSEADAGQPGA